MVQMALVSKRARAGSFVAALLRMTEEREHRGMTLICHSERNNVERRISRLRGLTASVVRSPLRQAAAKPGSPLRGAGTAAGRDWGGIPRSWQLT